MSAMLGRVWYFLGPRERLGSAGLFVLMLLGAGLEMLSLMLIVPLARLVFGEAEQSWAQWLKSVLGMDGFAFILTVSIGFAVLFVVKNCGLLAIQFLVSHFTTHRLAVFQTRLYRHYLERPYELHAADHSGLQLRNLTSAAAAVFDSLRAALAISLETILLLTVCATLAWLSPMTALAGLAGIGILGGVYYLLTGAHLERWGVEANQAQGRLMTWAVQGLAAVKDIIVLDRAAYFQDRLATQANRLARVRTWRQTSQVLPRAVIETVLVIIMIIAMVSAYGQHRQVEDLLATIGVVGLVVMRAVPSLNRVLGLLGELRQFTAEITTLYDEMAVSNHVIAVAPDGDEPLSFDGSICLDAVAYVYPNQAQPALDDISLTIAKGETIGVIGPSGAGKSTLVDVLLGLLTPQKGELRCGNQRIRGHEREWRRNIGYVPQSIYLIDDTIRRNIAFGFEDDKIDETRLHEALRLSSLGDVVATLPDGLDTKVGEGGTRLSGGQRQRVGIARALYNAPPLLIFDEATSALDNEIEREIVAAINGLKGLKTIIIIAHRLSTVAGCDRVVMLRHGQVADSGSLDQLVARHPSLAARGL